VSLISRDAVIVHPIDRSIPLGVIAAALSVPVAVVSVLAGQLGQTLGFGRSAGLRSAVAGSVLGLVVVAATALLI
jgi:hypothetical protein